MNTRRNFVCWKFEASDLHEAADLSEPLLSDYEHVLGPDHPDTLQVMFQLGVCLARSGKWASGFRMLREGLSRTEVRFGSAHPLAQAFRKAFDGLGFGGAILVFANNPMLR